MFIFKYHPDNLIYYKGKLLYSFAEFVEVFPTFPIIEGDFFEYGETKFVHINSDGHDIAGGGTNDQVLIIAIDNIDNQLTEKFNNI